VAEVAFGQFVHAVIVQARVHGIDISIVSSKGVMRMPWRAKIFQSYFMFWPIFRTRGLRGPVSRGKRFGQPN
jgi:hypothetical protein